MVTSFRDQQIDDAIKLDEKVIEIGLDFGHQNRVIQITEGLARRDITLLRQIGAIVRRVGWSMVTSFRDQQIDNAIKLGEEVIEIGLDFSHQNRVVQITEGLARRDIALFRQMEEFQGAPGREVSAFQLAVNVRVAVAQRDDCRLVKSLELHARFLRQVAEASLVPVDETQQIVDVVTKVIAPADHALEGLGALTLGDRLG